MVAEGARSVQQVLLRQLGVVVLGFLVLAEHPESQEQMEVPRHLAVVAEE